MGRTRAEISDREASRIEVSCADNSKASERSVSACSGHRERLWRLTLLVSCSLATFARLAIIPWADDDRDAIPGFDDE